jgi:hypothetical protein
MAAYLGLKVRTLRDWRYRRLIPYIKIRRKIQYNVVNTVTAVNKFERQVK